MILAVHFASSTTSIATRKDCGRVWSTEYTVISVGHGVSTEFHEICFENDREDPGDYYSGLIPGRLRRNAKTQDCLLEGALLLPTT